MSEFDKMLEDFRAEDSREAHEAQLEQRRREADLARAVDIMPPQFCGEPIPWDELDGYRFDLECRGKRCRIQRALERAQPGA